MQSMAELVEHRVGVVPTDQHRLVRPTVAKIGVVRNDGRDISRHSLLQPIAVHRGAGFLAVTRVRVEVPEPDMAAVGPEHPIDGHVGMEHGYAGDSLEAQAIEALSGPE